MENTTIKIGGAGVGDGATIRGGNVTVTAKAEVLRYDIGKRIEDNLARFQKGLFYQFFFGWDF